jgi:hypothetical protein
LVQVVEQPTGCAAIMVASEGRTRSRWHRAPMQARGRTRFRTTSSVQGPHSSPRWRCRRAKPRY